MAKINDLFVGWYDYSESEYENILKYGDISFDTNVILNLYRYSKETSLKTLSLFNSVKDRLVTSYYVTYEFTKNREKTESDSIHEYDKLINKIDEKYENLINEMNNISEKKLVKKNKLIDSILKNRIKIVEALNGEKAKKEELYNEDLEGKILDLIGETITSKFGDSEYKKNHIEGLRRIKEQIPPGYKDTDKPENGDYYIFRSLMDYSKKFKKDIIFVTDDMKEDWFQNINGIKKPRPELLNEFFSETGQKLIIFSLQDFLKNKVIFTDNISDSILNEIYITSLEHQKLSNHTNSRIKKYLYNISKYNSVESLIRNIDEVKKCFRTIIRISEGFNDIETMKNFSILLNLLEYEEYDKYLIEFLPYSDKIKSLKRKDIERVKYYYNKCNETNNSNDLVELLNYIYKYMSEYLNSSYESKTNIIKIRELIGSIKNENISPDKLHKEINKFYDYLALDDAMDFAVIEG